MVCVARRALWVMGGGAAVVRARACVCLFWQVRLVEKPRGGFRAVPQDVMEEFTKAVGLGLVEMGGYFVDGIEPRSWAPYGKYTRGGALRKYSPGWLQRALWAVGHHHRVHGLESPVWTSRGSRGMKCYDEYMCAQQRLATNSRLHVATAMVDEKWQEIRPLLDLEKRRDKSNVQIYDLRGVELPTGQRVGPSASPPTSILDA